jgi:hypothetical protein
MKDYTEEPAGRSMNLKIVNDLNHPASLTRESTIPETRGTRSHFPLCLIPPENED